MCEVKNLTSNRDIYVRIKPDQVNQSMIWLSKNLFNGLEVQS